MNIGGYQRIGFSFKSPGIFKKGFLKEAAITKAAKVTAGAAAEATGVGRANLLSLEPHLIKKIMSEYIGLSDLSSLSMLLASCTKVRTIEIMANPPLIARDWIAPYRTIKTIQHDYCVRSATFSNDGQYVVTASYDNTAKIYPLWFKLLSKTLSHKRPFM